MRFDVVTVMPGLIAEGVQYGVVGRALDAGLIQVQAWNPRDFTDDAQGRVDDRPYGGGPGMVMQAEPLQRTVEAARAASGKATVVALTPQGEPLDQAGVLRLASEPGLVLVCGRYEGMDERFVDSSVDCQLSIGDYVLTGGELAALVVIDAVARWVPGVLGHQASADRDCFSDGLLGCPQYTRPECVRGEQVPSVLLSGDHAAVDRWRLQQSLGRTWLRRPDLLVGRTLTAEQQQLLNEFIEDYRGRPSSVDGTEANVGSTGS